jgi:hypothetical protein
LAVLLPMSTSSDEPARTTSTSGRTLSASRACPSSAIPFNVTLTVAVRSE